MLDLFEELSAVTASLSDAGIPHALVGGLAYSFYVELRATEDIDFLIAEAEWPAVSRVLAPLGYEQLAGPMDFDRIRIRRLTKIAGGDVLVLDFLLADERTSHGLSQPVRFPFREHTIPLAPVEVIIDLKTTADVAQRGGGSSADEGRG